MHMYWCLYVWDDILIIYDAEATNHDYLTQYTNTIHNNLQFNPTLQSEGHINFLDLTITRRNTHIEIDIYRKPTTTHTTIHFTSTHPNEHKLAAYRYHISRMLSLPLKATQQKREWETILHIAQQNGFPPAMIHKQRHQIEHKAKHISPQDRKNEKWATFTYISQQIRKITNLFSNTNIRIAYKCRNTIANRIKPPRDHTQPHNKWGIYQLTCNACNLSYVGQTSRSLSIRYKEHIRYIRSNNPQSAYALYILQNRHEYGPVNNTMTLIKHINNRSLLLPYEQYHIQSLHHNRKLIPEQNPGDTNPLFQAVINP